MGKIDYIGHKPMTMQPGEDPNAQPHTQPAPPQQIIHGEQQNAQFATNQQQIVYINLKYKPEVNFRHISYIVIGIGITLYFGIFIFSMETDSFLMTQIGTSLCCFSFCIGFILDGMFYKGKADWEVSTGQSNGGSITGMVFDFIFAIIAIAFAILTIVGMGLIGL